MPQLASQAPSYNPPKTTQLDWNTFTKGLDTLLKQTEIHDQELAQADNLQLVGRGVPSRRNGTDNYFLAGSSVATGTQQVRGLKGVLFASGASGVNELLAATDFGYLVKKSGASYSIVPGFSYASGYPMEMVQSFNNVYIVNANSVLTKYNGVTISAFTSISRPTGLTATNSSGVSGTYSRSFRVSAFSTVGETLASNAVIISNTPQSLACTSIRLSWTTSSPTSQVVGYGIYGYDSGDERLITTVDPSTTRYDYTGNPEPSQLVYPPTADSTSGPISKHIITHKDKVVLGNIEAFPSRIMWSGGGINIDKFNWRYGGGYVDIDKDSGDRITGLVEYQDSTVVFKERSIWQVSLAAVGSIVVPSVKMIIRGVGCISHRTIRHVENDVFFLSRRGVFSLGNEAQYIANVLRTNELSAKVRPIFAGLSLSVAEKACAIYQDNKYRLSYPSGTSTFNNKEIIYDRERLAWMGPNSYPATSGVYEVYYDGANKENLLWGDSQDNWITQYDSSFDNDKGTKIQTTLLTKKTSITNPFRFKQVRSVYSNWRNVAGTPNVNIILEGRDGVANIAESFTFISQVGGGVGWGFDKWGTFKWGSSLGAGSSSTSNEIIKRTRVNKPARNVQMEVTTTNSNEKYELLSIQIQGQELGEGIIPSSWNTN